jgi:orotidine-5'-phosphate decarboxylase
VFRKRIESLSKKHRSLLCVGLDPELAKIKAYGYEDIYSFNKAIVDSTADLVCAYKPQVAYYSSIGEEKVLGKTIEYIRDTYPEIPIILDAKRGDIGSTAKHYAVEAFERYGVDAVTVNPYLGLEALQPFLEYKDHGVIVLCKTSNPGAGQFQDMVFEGKELFRHIADAVQATGNPNAMLVVGATYTADLRLLRAQYPALYFLVPGIGAQGGDLEAVLRAGLDKDRLGIIINTSRSVLYPTASHGDEQSHRQGVREHARQLQAIMSGYVSFSCFRARRL